MYRKPLKVIHIYYLIGLIMSTAAMNAYPTGQTTK